MDLQRAIRSATVAEVAWTRSGRPDAQPVTPLLLADQPVLALPYAFDAFARALAGADSVTLVLSDPRMTSSGWHSLAITGRPELVHDREGEIFTEQLLDQELRKYPPARVLADSPLLRREHWWFMPRLLLLIDVKSVAPVKPRKEPNHQVLAVASGGALKVDTVDAKPIAGGAAHEAGVLFDGHDEQMDHLHVTSLAGEAVPDGSCVLLAHDFSEPDLERWSSWLTRGHLHDGVMCVSESPGTPVLEAPLTVRNRLRRHRSLEKGCRHFLKD